MDVRAKGRWANTGTYRTVACAALLSVALGGCSSVPDAVNPVKWYEKTTDFFSGDSQAADMQTATNGTNQGLAADPDAPAPAVAAPAQDVTQASGGLSGDQVASNYASPPIERQGAPGSVLQAPDQAPVPPAQPTIAVTSAPVAPMAPMAPMATPQPVPTAPMQMADIPPVPTMPARMSMEGAPPPPTFNLMPTASPFDADVFETVVISGDGMTVEPTAQPKLEVANAPGDQLASTGARFPEPGTTLGGGVDSVSVGSMTRAATINFANNAASLDARDRSILGAVVQLQRERGGRVVVVGHASSRTKDMDYITHKMVNFQISMQRAATIGNALKDLGLAGEHLEVQAVSDSEPLFTEVMPSGEAGNRRVEIYLAP